MNPMIKRQTRQRLPALFGAAVVAIALTASFVLGSCGNDRPKQIKSIDDLSDAEILDNFLKIAMKNEFGPARPIWKWEVPIKAVVFGDDGTNYLEAVKRQVTLLHQLTNHPITLEDEVYMMDDSLLQKYDQGRFNYLILISKSDWRGVFQRYEPFFLRFYITKEVIQARTNFLIQTRANCFGTMVTRYRFLADPQEMIVIVILTNQPKRQIDRCIAEELTQTLGLTNDDPTVLYSIFNDEMPAAVQSELTEQDKLMVRILYDPRLKNGMTKEDVLNVAPQIIKELRASKKNEAIQKSGAISQ